ncbi:MAG: GntR family transcriptional regulator [Thermomicrobiales bacterium]
MTIVEKQGASGGALPVGRALRAPHLRGSVESGGQRADQAAEAIKRYILTNRLPPGTRLPPERHLADALMTGRNALREALHSLATLGIVEKRHGSGVYVREFDIDRLADQLSYGLREGAAYWSQLLEARIETELMLIPLVARRITNEQIEQLRGQFATMRDEITHPHYTSKTDLEFHLALVSFAVNPVLERLARAVIVEYFRYTSSLRLDLVITGNPITIGHHEPLIDALAHRDVAASLDAMRFHFRHIRAYVNEQARQASALAVVASM